MALTFARDIAKQTHGDQATREAKSAPDAFDKTKEGGKKRTRVKTKSCKCKKQLTAKEQVTLALEKARSCLV